jgi:fatty acid desaturase
MSTQSAVAFDPYTRFRRSLLTPDEIRELSRLTPARPVRDVLLLWAQIFAAWAAVAVWTEWWVVLLTIPVIGTRHYAMHVIGHDGIHRRLFNDPRVNDLFNDALIFGPEGAVTHLNGQNHLLHHRYLSNEADPDRFKYTSSNKTTRLELVAYLCGLTSLVPLWRNVFRRDWTGHTQKVSERRQSRGREGYTLRDLAIIGGSQAALIVGLTLAIGWWAYPLLWLVPVYAFTYCGDQTRFFLEHAYPEPDEATEDRRLITYTSNPVERMFFAPKNMNFHAVHHLWPSIPYYNLPRADAMVRGRDGARGLVWRPSYVGALRHYFRALPLPGCRTAAD